MPLQNRVTPFSCIVADPARGLFMGNRGCLHDERRHLVSQGWRTKAWIICLTRFKGRQRALMQPRRYTELFFLDEATALAAGHRPCAECRRAAFTAFLRAWAEATGNTPRAPVLDAALHAQRVPAIRGEPRRQGRLAEMPDGAFVTRPDRPDRAYLVLGGRLLPWSLAGYRAPIEQRPDAGVVPLTPAPSLAALAAGYQPVLHPSAAL